MDYRYLKKGMIIHNSEEAAVPTIKTAYFVANKNDYEATLLRMAGIKIIDYAPRVLWDNGPWANHDYAENELNSELIQVIFSNDDFREAIKRKWKP